MAVTLSGINTGLPPNLVDQLIEVERIPIKNIEGKKAKAKAQLDLVKDLETKLRSVTGSMKDLATTGGFTDIKLISGDPNVIGGVVDPSTSINGTWNVEVMQLAQKAAALSNGFPDKDETEIGVGYFQFQTEEGTKEVYLSGGTSTLEGAARAINSSGLNVQAAVINDRRDKDNPYRLMITSKNVGGDNHIEFPQLYFLDGDQDFYFEEERPALNGKIKVDGIEFEIPDNEVKDVIPGVTLDLKQASPGRPVNVTIKEDREVVAGKVKTFVDSMNAILSFIQGQNKMNENTDTTQTLGGDSSLRTVENRLRRMIQDPIFGTGKIQYLSQLGIGYNRGGTLDFDEKKFNAALAADPQAVQNFFVGDGFSTGFIPRIRNNINTLVDSAFGAVTQRKRGLEDKMRQFDDRIANLERLLQRKEQNLRRQFSNLETTMSRLKSQGAYLQQKLGGGGGGLGTLNFGGMSDS